LMNPEPAPVPGTEYATADISGNAAVLSVILGRPASMDEGYHPGPLPKWCVKELPYSPDEFMRRLLESLRDPDPRSLPRNFMHAFHIKMKSVGPPSGAYVPVPRCAWPISLGISVDDLLSPGHIGATVDMGNHITVLPFSSATGSRCLTREPVDRAMSEADFQCSPFLGSFWKCVKQNVSLRYMFVTVLPYAPSQCAAEVQAFVEPPSSSN